MAKLNNKDIQGRVLSVTVAREKTARRDNRKGW
jgi:hypothetical protein